jgi:hypothetical protein
MNILILLTASESKQMEEQNARLQGNKNLTTVHTARAESKKQILDLEQRNTTA